MSQLDAAKLQSVPTPLSAAGRTRAEAWTHSSVADATCDNRRSQQPSIVRVAAGGLVAVRHERERLDVVRRQLGRRHHCDRKQECPTNQHCPVSISRWCSPGGGGAGRGGAWTGVVGRGWRWQLTCVRYKPVDVRRPRRCRVRGVVHLDLHTATLSAPSLQGTKYSNGGVQLGSAHGYTASAPTHHQHL